MANKQYKKELGLLPTPPYGKSWAMRRGGPILVDNSLLSWRKRERKKKAKARLVERKKARYRELEQEATAKIHQLILNPFAPTEDS